MAEISEARGMTLPAHIQKLASKMEQHDSVTYDKWHVETTMQRLLEEGEFKWIERTCREWLSRVERKDMVG